MSASSSRPSRRSSTLGADRRRRMGLALLGLPDSGSRKVQRQRTFCESARSGSPGGGGRSSPRSGACRTCGAPRCRRFSTGATAQGRAAPVAKPQSSARAGTLRTGSGAARRCRPRPEPSCSVRINSGGLLAVDDFLPPDLDDLEPEDDAAIRVRACGVPYPEWGWGGLREWRAEGVSAADLRDWGRSPTPARWGLLLHGEPGLGKTVAACCAVRDAAERRVGSAGAWVVVTAPRTQEAVVAGAFRQRPGPAQFYRWRDLKARLDAAKTGALPWAEEPPLTADKLLGEIEGRGAGLALDDVDVDAHTPWKEELLLRLLEIPQED